MDSSPARTSARPTAPALARAAVVAFAAVAFGSPLAACTPTPVTQVEDPRGDVNGESFELISDRDDRGEWSVRIRGDSMWVAHTEETETRELGKFKLTAEEMEELWEMVQDLDYAEGDPADLDQADETLLYRHRVPGEANYTASMDRADALESKKIRRLLKFLRGVIQDHAGEKARL